jgi:hypothetical protein
MVETTDLTTNFCDKKCQQATRGLLLCWQTKKFSSFVHYQQRFRAEGFLSAFVRNLNFNNFIGPTVGLDKH